MSGRSNTLICISQNVNVTSGETYRLIYNFSGTGEKSLVVFRDLKTGKRKFFNSSGNNKQHEYEIKANNSGTGCLYFCVDENESCYYSNIYLLRYNNKLIKVYKGITAGLIIVFLLFFSLHDTGLTLFIAFLAILPIVNINNNTISEAENRNLAKFKPLFFIAEGKYKVNNNFGLDFNNWINDRFFGRNFIIKKFNALKFYVEKKHENEVAFEGIDGWLFQKHNYLDKNYVKTCEKIKKNIDILSDYYLKRGIKTYFLVIPEKESLYSDKHFYRKFDKEKIPEYLSILCTNNFIYLKPFLEKAKKSGYTHFKEDHHWTQYGAFVGYQAIMNLIKKDFDISVLDKERFLINKHVGAYDNQAINQVFKNRKINGTTYNFLKLNESTYNFSNIYYVYTPHKMPTLESTGERHAIFNGGSNNLKVMLIGDSNIGYILPFISSSFSNSLFLYASGLSKYPNNWKIQSYNNIIFEYKPQILIVIVRACSAISWEELY